MACRPLERHVYGPMNEIIRLLGILRLGLFYGMELDIGVP